MAAQKERTITMEYKKETKGTFIYEEVLDGQPPTLKTAYFAKWAYPGHPKTLKLVITVEDE
jgi:hypothetical protein